MRTRRTSLFLTASLAVLSLSGQAWAQSKYPEQTGKTGRGFARRWQRGHDCPCAGSKAQRQSGAALCH